MAHSNAMSESAQRSAAPQWERSCPGQRPTNTSSKFASFIAALLLVGLALQLTLSGRQQSQTFDEADHILAGYRYWMCSDFSANPEHPPLVKLVASVPLLLMKLKGPAPLCGYPNPSTNRDFVDARTFLYSNNAESILFSTRLFACLFTIFLGVLVFKSAHLMFGTGPALIALTIFAFEPNILAHGFLVTTDMGLACCLYGAVFAFNCYLEERSIAKLALTGILAGCTAAAKHSGVVIFPILLVIAIVDPAMHAPLTSEGSRSLFRLRLRMMFRALTCIGLIAYITVWAFYAFRFSARPASAALPLGVGFTQESQRLAGRVFKFLLHIHFLPESYLLGLKHVLAVVRGGGPVFLLGRAYPNGRWFYFPVVFLLKSTLGFLLLLMLGSVPLSLAKSRDKRALWIMIIPPLLFMAICLASNLDLGIRHILPIYPFLIVVAAAGVWNIRKYRVARYIVASLIAIHVVSSLRSFPDYLPYSNEAFGGTKNTYKLLGASNADWGQSLWAINRYVQANEVGECWIAYMTTADPTYRPSSCRLLPTAESWISRDDMSEPRVHGTVLIGANELEWITDLSPYAQFRNIVPSQRIGGSVMVFQGQFELPRAFALSQINRAAILIQQGQFAESIIVARKAVTAAPETFSTHAALARALAAAHRDKESQTEFQSAILLAETIDAEYHPRALEQLQRELRQLSP